MIVLTQFEANQLFDHCKKSGFFWSNAGDLWLRSTEEGPAFGLRLQLHEVEGWTVFLPVVHAMDWPKEKAEGFVDRLIRCWTSYLVRVRLQTVLEVDLGVDSGKAELVAMKLQEIAHSHVDYPAPVPDLPDADVVPRNFERTYLLSIGGYVHIEKKGRSILATLSLPSDEKHLAFGPPLEGFLTGPVHAHDPSGRWHE